MKLKLHHLNFCSTNVGAMDDFYRGVLDLDREATLGQGRVTSQGYPGKVAFITDGAMQIHLAEKDLGVKLSRTGMACAMCHPFASDTHPQEFPKFQEQINGFATLRDMINWCIEKPNEGKKIDPESEAMKALEAYIYWSNRGSKLDPGRH